MVGQHLHGLVAGSYDVGTEERGHDSQSRPLTVRHSNFKQVTGGARGQRLTTCGTCRSAPRSPAR